MNRAYFNPALPDAAGGGSVELSIRDTVALLRLMGVLGSVRNDPHNWRLELLMGLNNLLPATASIALALKGLAPDKTPAIVSLVDAGFKSDAQRQACLHEFNTAPLADPLSRLVLEKFLEQTLETLTSRRADVVDAPTWMADRHVQIYRKPTGMGDCMLSLHRSAERGSAYGLVVFRAAITPPGEGEVNPGTDVLAAGAFGTRERLLLDTLHRGLDWLYRAEEATRKLNPGSTLRPRLRETLELILSGDTERQVAEKMTLSVHTVHDYVKSLYIHFGVSSRTELLSRWVQDGGQIPPRREP